VAYATRRDRPIFTLDDTPKLGVEKTVRLPVREELKLNTLGKVGSF
jgi:hypothetical protein